MRDWSEDELRTVVEMYEDECTSVEIASRLPRKTVNQVRHLIIRHRDTLKLGQRVQPEDKKDDKLPLAFNTDACFALLRRPWTVAN